MQTMPCDIVLLPENSLAERAIAASQSLEQYGTLFTLKNGEYYPHASLYMFQLAVVDVDRVEAVIKKLAASIHIV